MPGGPPPPRRGTAARDRRARRPPSPSAPRAAPRRARVGPPRRSPLRGAPRSARPRRSCPRCRWLPARRRAWRAGLPPVHRRKRAGVSPRWAGCRSGRSRRRTRRRATLPGRHARPPSSRRAGPWSSHRPRVPDRRVPLPGAGWLRLGRSRSLAERGAHPERPGRRRVLGWLGGLPLEVRHLVGLRVGPLLAARQLVLGLALALLLAALAPQRRVVGQVSGRLLGATGDLVNDAHGRVSFRVHGDLPTRFGRETKPEPAPAPSRGLCRAIAGTMGAVPRLRRSDCSEPGIARVRRGRGFEYRDPDGDRVTDPHILGRISELAIPPAWRDVWISLDPLGHLQATGVDSAGRKQYLYHDRWRRRRDQAKFDSMLEFARALPAMRRRVRRDLRGDELTRARVLACATRLLDLGFFRMGSEDYAERNESYG